VLSLEQQCQQLLTVPSCLLLLLLLLMVVFGMEVAGLRQAVKVENTHLGRSIWYFLLLLIVQVNVT
jgi:hypothetical protein